MKYTLTFLTAFTLGWATEIYWRTSTPTNQLKRWIFSRGDQ